MKKNIYVLCIIVVSLAFASAAFAAQSAGGATIAGGTSVTISGAPYTASNGVDIQVAPTATAYCATSAQVSMGTMEYGTCGGAVASPTDASKIYSAAHTPGNEPDAPQSATEIGGNYQ